MESLPVRKFELTPRQLEVAKLYSEGHTYASIGKQLGMSPTTAGSYLRIIRVKLRAMSRVNLIAAIRKQVPLRLSDGSG